VPLVVDGNKYERDDLFNAVDETGGASMREKKEKAARALHRTASHATAGSPPAPVPSR